ncbi:MAG TPA: hypothetical protein VG056_06335, partial [Pirellulales bacterium]|nr:hypothetical protein [Pirellulales bacterium]
AAERAALEKVAALENDAVDAYLRLIELATEAEDWAAVELNARRILAVNPLIADPYRQLAKAAETLAHPADAIRARQVLLVIDASDPAEAHYRLSKLFHQQHELRAARRHVLQALEETPRFRAAQQLLLEIVEQSKDQKENAEATP